MRGCLRIGAATSLAATIGLSVLVAAPAQADTGWVITQREGKSTSRLTLATSGLRFDSLTPPRPGAKAAPEVSILIRYRDRHLFLLDPQRRQYDSVSLAAAVASYAAELKAASRGQPSAALPVRPGAKRVKGQAPLKLPRAHLRPLGLSTTIHGVRARAYLLRAGGLRQRLWYAAAIPRPPADVRALLARSGGGTGSSSLTSPATSQTGRVPLRIDTPRGRRWRTVLQTTRITRRAIDAAGLQPPSGYKERTLLDSTPKKAAATGFLASTPATAIRCGIVLLCGPVSSHPDVWAFFWGTTFNSRKDFVYSVSHGLENMVGDQFADPNSQAFWDPLGQYGVGRGRFLGYDIVDENPPDSVGSWNFFDIDAFVITHRFGSDAPNYWWRFSDHDPIIAIFVDDSQVAGGGWGGYHFFTPTEGLLFSFAVHPNMPWFIVRVPSLANLPQSRTDPRYLSTLATTTERASHELVEAATDPYPFTSWADPLKEPIWEQGEIGDICSQGNFKPYAQNARVLPGPTNTAFSTYWSNDDNACMPASQPTISIGLPTNGSTFSWGGQVTFTATASDTWDGKVDDGEIHWASDRDGALGTGHVFDSSTLSPGTHHITATVTDSQGASATAGPVTVNVVVQPPQVRITGPADGSSFAADQKINFRGSAFDGKDGDLAASARWSVDGAQVGTGATLFTHQIPTQGAHIVTLSVTNSGGLTATASIKVNIGPATLKPSVLITSPALGPGETDLYFGPGQVLTFSATADAQGLATISNSGYVWTDDVDGLLGTGPTITKTLSTAQTVHHITVTVTDSLGRSATDTITENFFSVG